MGVEELIQAVARVGKPPCEVHQCPKRAECAQYRLACIAFSVYVKTGAAHHPGLEYEEVAGRWKKPRFLRDPQPTRAVFDALDEDDGEATPAAKRKAELPASPQRVSSVWDLAGVAK